MRWFGVLLAVVLAACTSCGGSDPLPTDHPLSGAATDYALSAERALEGTAFGVLQTAELADIVIGLCDGLGVGAIGVAAADTGIAAPDAEVTILLEVLRRGLDQVCPERVRVDLTASFLEAVASAAGAGGGVGAYDEIGAIRAGPEACAALREGGDGAAALLRAADALFGVEAGSVDELSHLISSEQGVVVGAVLASAVALVCPEHLGAVEGLLEDL